MFRVPSACPTSTATASSGIRVSFRVKGDAPPEKLQEVVARAQRRSAVFDMVTNGVPVSVEAIPTTALSRGRDGASAKETSMHFELTAKTEAGGRLVALAETLAEDFATRAGSTTAKPATRSRASRLSGARGTSQRRFPSEHGGLGVTSVHDVLVASSRLARGDASVAIGVNMHLDGGAATSSAAGRWPSRPGTNGAQPRSHARWSGRARGHGHGRRDQRAQPGPHAPRDDRRAHRVGLACERPQDLLHDVAGCERPLHGGDLCGRGRNRALRLRAHPRMRPASPSTTTGTPSA